MFNYIPYTGFQPMRRNRILSYTFAIGLIGYTTYELYTTKARQLRLTKKVETIVGVANEMDNGIDTISSFLKRKFALSQH